MDYNRRTNRIINTESVVRRYAKAILDSDSIIPIGKHKGKRIRDIIEREYFYLDYMRKQGALLLTYEVRKIIGDHKKQFHDNRPQEDRQANLDAYRTRQKERKKRRQQDRAARNPQIVKEIFLFNKDKHFIKKYKSRYECAEDIGCNPGSFYAPIRSKQLFLKKYYVGYSQSAFMFF
jgi:hypothetical protein